MYRDPASCPCAELLWVLRRILVQRSLQLLSRIFCTEISWVPFKDTCIKMHKDLVSSFKRDHVWGSCKFPSARVLQRFWCRYPTKLLLQITSLIVFGPLLFVIGWPEGGSKRYRFPLWRRFKYVQMQNVLWPWWLEFWVWRYQKQEALLLQPYMNLNMLRMVNAGPTQGSECRSTHWAHCWPLFNDLHSEFLVTCDPVVSARKCAQEVGKK